MIFISKVGEISYLSSANDMSLRVMVKALDALAVAKTFSC